MTINSRKLQKIRHRRRVAKTQAGRPNEQAAMIARAIQGYDAEVWRDQRRETVRPGKVVGR